MAPTHSRSGRPSIRLRCVVFAAACAVAMSDGAPQKEFDLHLQHWNAGCHQYYVHELLNIHLSEDRLNAESQWNQKAKRARLDETPTLDAISEKVWTSFDKILAEPDNQDTGLHKAYFYTIDNKANKGTGKPKQKRPPSTPPAQAAADSNSAAVQPQLQPQASPQSQPQSQPPVPPPTPQQTLPHSPTGAAKAKLDFTYVVQPKRRQDLELLAKLEAVGTTIEQVAKLSDALLKLVTVNEDDKFVGKVEAVTKDLDSLKFEVKPKGLPKGWNAIRANDCDEGDTIPMLIHRDGWGHTGGAKTACTTESSYIVASFKGDAKGDNANDKFIVAGLHVKNSKDITGPPNFLKDLKTVMDTEYMKQVVVLLSVTSGKAAGDQAASLYSSKALKDGDEKNKQQKAAYKLSLRQLTDKIKAVAPDLEAEVRFTKVIKYAVITNFAHNWPEQKEEDSEKELEEEEEEEEDSDPDVEEDTGFKLNNDKFPTEIHPAQKNAYMKTNAIECGSLVVWKITAKHGEKGFPQGLIILVLVFLAVLASWLASCYVKPEEDDGKQKDEETEMAERSSGNK